MLSLTEMGTPRRGVSRSICSGLLAPDLMKRSTCCASFSASSNRSSTTQFSSGCTCLVRATNARITSSLLTCGEKNRKMSHTSAWESTWGTFSIFRDLLLLTVLKIILYCELLSKLIRLNKYCMHCIRLRRKNPLYRHQTRLVCDNVKMRPEFTLEKVTMQDP
jgi:hypothetical protein